MNFLYENFFKNKTSIFLFSFILFSIGSFYISFFPPDEPKYVDAALRMIEKGNYIIPFFNCHVRFDKPILFYWELVLFFKLFFVDHLIKIGHNYFGIIEYAARLPAVISAALSSVYVYKLSDLLFEDSNISRLSVLGFISIGFFMYLGRSVYPDMSLILFELMGIYYFIKNKYVLGWIFTALAFLVKGPIGVVSVGFTYFIYLWVVEKKTGLKEFFSFNNGLGFLAFLLVGLPWYIAVYHYYGMEFINKFLIYHNIERFTGAAHQHPHSFFYFFPIAILVLYIWWPYLLQLFKRIDLRNRKNLFLILWFAWVFLFFSISKNKLAHYIAFGFIPVAILFGRYIEDIKESKRISTGFFVLEVVLAFVLSFVAYKKGLIQLVASVFTGILIVSLTNLLKKPTKVIFYKTIAMSVVAFVVLLQFEGYRPEKFVWHEVLKTRLGLLQYKKLNQSLVAYTRMCLKEVRNPEVIDKIKGTFLIYTKLRHIKELKVKYKILAKFIDKGTKTVLLEVNNG